MLERSLFGLIIFLKILGINTNLSKPIHSQTIPYNQCHNMYFQGRLEVEVRGTVASGLWSPKGASGIVYALGPSLS